MEKNDYKILNIFGRFSKPKGGLINPLKIIKADSKLGAAYSKDFCLSGTKMILDYKNNLKRKQTTSIPKMKKKKQNYMSAIFERSDKKAQKFKKNASNTVSNKKENSCSSKISSFARIVLKETMDLLNTNKKTKSSDEKVYKRMVEKFLQNLSNPNLLKKTDKKCIKIETIVENLKEL